VIWKSTSLLAGNGFIFPVGIHNTQQLGTKFKTVNAVMVLIISLRMNLNHSQGKTTMNRIIASIAKTRTHITSLNLDQAQLDILNTQLNMSLNEYVLFQERKSLAFANGRLNLEEAQSVYAYLGETTNTFNKQPLEVKYVLTQLLKELLQSATE
jgi:hypothetical protein